MSSADLTHEVLRVAERIIYRAEWLRLQEQGCARLAQTRGLATKPLYPPSPVIQLVARDGVYLGKIRLDGPRGRHERWYATPDGSHWTLGPYRSPKAAAKALARASVDARRHPRPTGLVWEGNGLR